MKAITGIDEQGSARSIVLLGIAISVFFWVADSFVDAYIFMEGDILESLLSPGPREAWMRLLVMGLIAGLCVHAERLISERRAAERRLKTLVTTDLLTQAFNRAKFDEVIDGELERARRHGRPLSIVMFDIDDFKAVNDTHGHQAGDSVLKEVAEVVKKELRRTNIFIRWGGEEFLVIAVETGFDGAGVLAERLKEAIAGHDFKGVGTITASFGVAEWAEVDTPDTLIRKADGALYRAKTCGKNRVELFSGTVPPPYCGIRLSA